MKSHLYQTQSNSNHGQTACGHCPTMVILTADWSVKIPYQKNEDECFHSFDRCRRLCLEQTLDDFSNNTTALASIYVTKTEQERHILMLQIIAVLHTIPIKT